MADDGYARVHGILALNTTYGVGELSVSMESPEPTPASTGFPPVGMVAGGGFEPPTFGFIIPLLLGTLVGQLTDSQVPDQFELLAPIGPPIPVVCEHSHVEGTIGNLKDR